MRQPGNQPWLAVRAWEEAIKSRSETFLQVGLVLARIRDAWGKKLTHFGGLAGGNSFEPTPSLSILGALLLSSEGLFRYWASTRSRNWQSEWFQRTSWTNAGKSSRNNAQDGRVAHVRPRAKSKAT
jgi:hypothetical protein